MRGRYFGRGWWLCALACAGALVLPAACSGGDTRYVFGGAPRPNATGQAGDDSKAVEADGGRSAPSGGSSAAGNSGGSGGPGVSGSATNGGAGHGAGGDAGIDAGGGDGNDAGGGDTGIIDTECEPGKRSCLFGVPQSCANDGTWAALTPCPASAPSCLADTGECGTCEPGERQCGDPTTPEVCGADGTWTSLDPCGGRTPACLEGECRECDPDGAVTRRCVGDAPETCDPDGNWAPQPPCSGDTPRCLESTGRCVCEDGAVGCRDGNTPEACNAAGQWIQQADCSGDTPVCAAGVCACAEGRKECETPTTARVCSGGEWTVEYCLGTNTPACYQGICVQCVPDDRECTDSRTLRTCGALGTWSSEECPALCYGDACYDPRKTARAVACDWERPQVCEGTASCCLHDLALSRCISGGETCSWQADCDGPNDCAGAGQVCCFESGDAGGVDLKCMAGTTCDTPDPDISTRQRVCDPLNPVCPGGKVCVERTEIPRMPVFTCQ